MDLSNLSEYRQEEIKKIIDREKLIKEIETDLKTNPKYKDYFNQYCTWSVESFISFYVHKKAMWMEFGENDKRREQESMLYYSEVAFEKLWQIQQKKLFDLQCMWRAEQITIPGIEITSDFEYWSRLIEECTFLPPITEDEAELYHEYILHDTFEIIESDHDWQDYDQYRSEHYGKDNIISMPEWYQFYDSRMGTGALLGLNDIRGEKEDLYIHLYHEEEKRQHPEWYQPKPDLDNRPRLEYLKNGVLDNFVYTFEDRKVQSYYEVMRVDYENDEDFRHGYHFNEAIEILERAGKIELVYSMDWKESIFLTAKQYEKEQVYKAFPGVYKNYLSRINMGIGFKCEEEKVNDAKDLLKFCRERILKGRELNNEPADFNF